jgi:hypothetical protein
MDVSRAATYDSRTIVKLSNFVLNALNSCFVRSVPNQILSRPNSIWVLNPCGIC